MRALDFEHSKHLADTDSEVYLWFQRGHVARVVMAPLGDLCIFGVDTSVTRS